MKNFAKLLVVAVAVTLIASMFALYSSAAAAPVGDPKTLTPGSDNVIFISDEYEGGAGHGLDAENPLAPLSDPEGFDANAETKKMHLTTAFYQATDMLKETGGTIVICGPVFLGIDQSYGTGSSTRDTFTAVYGEHTIKFTSVYNGVDYRETKGAKITLADPAEMTMRGQTIIENIDIETKGTDRIISFCDYMSLVGEGVNCYPEDEDFEGVDQYYPSLAGGHRYAKNTDKVPTLTVQSGTYNKITGAMWGTVSSQGSENCTSYLTLEGTTTVLGEIIGSSRANSPFGGYVNITINSGTYACDINGCGGSGFTNADGTVKITVNGGDFYSMWSVNDSAANTNNNPPAYSILDFTGWKGELSSLAALYGVASTFTEIKLPDGVTEDAMTKALDEYLKEHQTEAPETETQETPNSGDESNNNPPTTKAPATSAAAPATTAAPNSTDDTNKEGGFPVWLIVVIVVVVVAIVAVVAVMATKKKKTK